MDKLTQDELDRLRLSVKEAAFSDIGLEVKDVALTAADHEVHEDIVNYLKNFAALKRDENGNKVKNNPCLRCDLPLYRSIAHQLMGSDGGFEWGLAHGRGRCRNCGWPAQLYHWVKDRHGEEILKFSHVVLQIHPKHIEVEG